MKNDKPKPITDTINLDKIKNLLTGYGRAVYYWANAADNKIDYGTI